MPRPTSSDLRGQDAAEQPLARALGLLGDRWTLRLVVELLQGPRRFVDLQKALARVAPNTLSSRLKRLEEAGVIIAVPYQTRPVRHAYELTEHGAALQAPLRLLDAWAGERDGGSALAHETCGTPAEVRWFCPTCDIPIPAPATPGSASNERDELVWL